MTQRRWYKTVRMDGGSMYDPDFRYAVGKTVRRRQVGPAQLCADTVLHASPTPPLAATFAPPWPYRLIEVAGKPVVEDDDKAGFRQLTVVGELDVAGCFGPGGAKVVALLRRCATLTGVEATAMAATRAATRVAIRAAAWAAARDAALDATLDAAWDATRDAAGDATQAAAWAAAWDATQDAAWDAARDATRDAARAYVVEDLIGQHGYTQTHHDLLVTPWESAVGEWDGERWVTK